MQQQVDEKAIAEAKVDLKLQGLVYVRAMFNREQGFVDPAQFVAAAQLLEEEDRREGSRQRWTIRWAAAAAISGLISTILAIGTIVYTGFSWEAQQSAREAEQLAQRPYLNVDVFPEDRSIRVNLTNIGVHPAQFVEGAVLYSHRVGSPIVLRLSLSNEIPAKQNESVELPHAKMGAEYLVVALTCRDPIAGVSYTQDPLIWRRQGAEDPLPVSVADKVALLMGNLALRDTLESLGVQLDRYERKPP